MTKRAIDDLDFVPRRTRDLLKFMVKPYFWRSLSFFMITMLGITAWIASPVVIASVINRLGTHKELNGYIWWMVVLYLVLRVLDEVLWRTGEALVRTFKPQMIERIRLLLFSNALKKSYAYSVNSSSGRVGHWINQTTATTNEVVDITIWTVWSRIISLIVAAFFLLTVHWSLAVIFVVWLILLFWYTTHRGKEFARLIELQSDETSVASGMVVDSVSNHVSVRVFNAQEREKQMLMKQQRHIIKRWRESWWQNINTNIVKGQSAAFVSTLALVVVLVLFAKGMVPLGGIVLFITYFGDASSSLWQLAWSLDTYFRNFGTIQNALDGLNGEEARTGEVVPAVKVPKKVHLTVEDVTFAYADDKGDSVLENLNLEVPSGKRLGIVGHSGAGKSTLMGLLLGFYEPNSGRILINEIDIASKDPSFVRSVSSFVPQDTNLFNRTVRENITYGKPNATEAELTKALKQAQAWEFVSKLPNGLDTLVGERGVKLSGGQRQRIAIARAILQDSPLLLLDEATSALDSVSEQAIQKALYSLMQDRTTIVIAHRLSTLKNLDNIVVIDQGKIVEQGNHDELIKQKGIYADLWARQKDGFIVD